MNEPLAVREAPTSYQVELEAQRVRPGYKPSDLGTIPEDWDVIPMGQISQCLIGLTYSPRDVRDFGTLVLRSSNVQNGRLEFNDNVFVDMDIPTRAITRENDILICVRNGSRQLIGKCALIDGNTAGSAFGAFMSVLRSDSAKFLFFEFQSNILKRQIDEVMGATINQITNKNMAAFKVIWPSTKAEQEAIAEALSDADALIESLEQLIAKKRQLKQGTMQELLTGNKRLPGFSGDWEVKRLGDVIEKIIGGGTPSRSNSQYWGNEIPWVTVKDFATFDPRSAQEAITKTGLQHSASHLIPKGTLITSTRMALGKAVIYEVDVAINQDLKALFPKSVLATQFLYFWFQYHGQSIDELGSGSTVKGISLPDLKKIEFPLPLMPEQTAIATILSDMDTEIAALETRLTKTRELKQGMMHNLLTGRIRLL